MPANLQRWSLLSIVFIGLSCCPRFGLAFFPLEEGPVREKVVGKKQTSKKSPDEKVDGNSTSHTQQDQDLPQPTDPAIAADSPQLENQAPTNRPPFTWGQAPDFGPGEVTVLGGNTNRNRSVNGPEFEREGHRTPEGNTVSPLPIRNWTSIEIVLSISSLLFGLVCLCLQTFLVLKMKDAWTPTGVLRMTALTMIVTSILVLITAGYSSNQIAPAMGLLGSIGGYLLGSATKSTPEEKGTSSTPSA